MSRILARVREAHAHIEAANEAIIRGQPAPLERTAKASALLELALEEDAALIEAAPPTVVCLCGSTRFSEAFREANLRETLAGKIVLSIGCDTKSDQALGLGPEAKAQLDELHLRKIDLADEVLVLNVGGYIGESTSREIAYAQERGKPVRYLEPPTPAIVDFSGELDAIA